MNKDIKVIIFDLGQVLIDLHPEACMEAFGRLGADNISQLMSEPGTGELLDKFELGTVSVDMFCENLKPYLHPGTKNEQIIEAWNKMLGEIPAYKLDAILELRKHYRVFLLSNTNLPHWLYTVRKYFDSNGHTVGDFFVKAYTSFELHLMKPDKAIYEYVLKDIQARPQEVFFVDDRGDNCLSAARLGMKVYQAQPREDWRHLFG